MTIPNSPAPGTPQTSTKAVVGAVAAGVVAALTTLVAALSDNVVSPAEVAQIAIALIVGAGLTGGVVFGVPNKAKV